MPAKLSAQLPEVQATGYFPDQANLPLQHELQLEYEQYLHKQDRPFHTSMRPFRMEQLASHVHRDSLWQLTPATGDGFMTRAWNQLAYDNMLRVRNDDFQLNLDPLVNFSAGQDFEVGRNTWNYTRGFLLSGKIGHQFSFASSLRENQIRLPHYIDEFVRDRVVMPGQGRIRRMQGGFDYANAMGYISYTPSQYVNFQFGHGKQFIGEGYRSLLLSDNAFNYPYFKITTEIWKLQYTNLFAQFQNLGENNFVTGFQKKFGSFHYLNYAATDWLQIGLFEGVIWQTQDSATYRGFDFNYLNPVIFYRPVEFGLGSPDNAILGINLKLLPVDDIVLYGQFLVDDIDVRRSRLGEGFYRNKFGYQLGVKWFQPFEVENLVLRAEFNQVEPFTYAHKTIEQNYTHDNQELAHPLGANFQEFLGQGTWRKDRFYTTARLQYAIYGADTADSHFGKNVFQSDFLIADFPDAYGHYMKQGLKTKLISGEIRAGYILNPATRMSLEASVLVRRLSDAVDQRQDTKWFQLGIKTNLFNAYYDF